MTNYDVRFYGVYFHYKSEFSGVNMYQTKEQRHAVPGFENLFFEATALKEFGGRKDVLKLEFEDGTCEYETLNSPFEYLEDGIWKKSHNTDAPEAFIKLCISMRLNNV